MDIQIGSEPGLGSHGPTTVAEQAKSIQVLVDSEEQPQIEVDAKRDFTVSSRHPVRDRPDSENLWKLICDFKV